MKESQVPIELKITVNLYVDSLDLRQKMSYKILINKNILLFSGALFSAFIYFFYRGSSIIFNQILSTFWLDCFFCKDLIAVDFPLQEWIVYSLPGGIWVFVLSVIVQNNHIQFFNRRLPLDYLPIVYGIGLEILQFFHCTDGTFDWVDLLLIIIGFMFSKILFKESISVPFSWNYSRHNILIISGFVVLILSDVY
jgi:hypothetical protein